MNPGHQSNYATARTGNLGAAWDGEFRRHGFESQRSPAGVRVFVEISFAFVSRVLW